MERCSDCGQLPDWRGLQAHHVRIKGMGGRKDEGPTVKLCGSCHAKRHGLKEVDSKPMWSGGNLELEADDYYFPDRTSLYWTVVVKPIDEDSE